MTADQIGSLQPQLAAFLEWFRPFFATEPSFKHLQRYLLGLLTDLKRKSIEPIALAAGVPVRTLQEFLAFFVWDHVRCSNRLQQLVMDEHGGERAIGVIDASGHPKRGDKTPGVQRQYCGETGKIDNCIVGQHLLYTNNHPSNPFSCMLACDLYLPKSWADDRQRCREAKIPDTLEFRTKWRIAADQVKEALGNGIRLAWLTFDEDYGNVPAFWFELDALGQRAIGEVPSNFKVWPKRPACQSLQGPFAAKEAANICRYSPIFTEQAWQRVKVKEATRGPVVWEVKAARVHLVDTRSGRSQPTDRQYWLLVARHVDTGEIKYFVSNAPANVTREEMLQAAFARWHVEKWFERGKQEVGLGAFEVRTYASLIRHWLCCRLAMYFLAAATQRLRGEKSADYAGASGRGSQHVSREDLAAELAMVDGVGGAMRILSGA
jgi:SRSO17 transposase